MKQYQKNICDKVSFMKSSKLEYLPINNENFVPVK